MTRKYLTEKEVKHLLDTVSQSATSVRDHCMIQMAFLHGLRVSELLSLTLQDYDSLSETIHIHRLKGGLCTRHPLIPEESTLLQLWLCERTRLDNENQPWLFLSRQGKKLSRQRFYQVVQFYGEKAKLPLTISPHMLRHACGYSLADRGNDTRLIQDYLGHKNIRHTVLYTAANSGRFFRAWGISPPSNEKPHSVVFR